MRLAPSGRKAQGGRPRHGRLGDQLEVGGPSLMPPPETSPNFLKKNFLEDTANKKFDFLEASLRNKK